MKPTIENIAKILILNKISFTYDYDNECITVINTELKYNLFEIATYHTKTKKLVLMCYDYTKAISFEDFLNYFSTYKQLKNSKINQKSCNRITQ